MAEDAIVRHDRMGYSLTKPSFGEAGLMAVEEAGLVAERERRRHYKHQSHDR
jgi:hypothetical protein